MPIKKLTLLALLLTFLSGTFTFNRLDLGFSLDIKYTLFLAFILFFLVGMGRGSKLHKIEVNTWLLTFLIITLTYFFSSMLSLFYTTDQYTGLGKAESLLFLVITIIALLVMVSHMEVKEFYQNVSLFFIVFGMVYCLPIYLEVLSGADRASLTVSGPNVATRILFFAACCAVYRFISNNKMFYIILSILFLSGIVLVGSRGGLVGAIITLLILQMVKKNPFKLKFKKNPQINLRKLLLLSAGGGVVFLVFDLIKRVFMERIIGITFENEEIYTSGRDNFYSLAVQMIRENPIFGHGIDSFTAATGINYPHNLFLEMMVEIGLIGAGAFLFFVLFSFWILFKLRKSSLFIFSGLPLYMMIVQMFSGEFYDFRYFFFWMIPLLYFGKDHLKHNWLSEKETILQNTDHSLQLNVKENPLQRT